MIRNILLMGVFLFIVLLGVWIHMLRGQNEKLTGKLHSLEGLYVKEQETNRGLQERLKNEDLAVKTETSAVKQSRTQLQEQINSEYQKLVAMKKRLTEVSAERPPPAADDPEEHINSDQQDIDGAQKRLSYLNDENRSVDEKSKMYMDQEAYQRDAQKIDLQKQMNAIDQQMHTNQAQVAVLKKSIRTDPNATTQIAQLNNENATLKTQKDQLGVQKSEIDLQSRARSSAAAGEARREKDEVDGEKQHLNQRLAELRGDLDKWRKTKAERSKGKPESESVATLRRDIATQTEKVTGLQRMLQALPAK